MGLSMYDTPNSSNIKSVSYDEDLQKLTVTFKRSNSAYIYEGVPRKLFEDMKVAPSAGKFFISNVKNNPNYKWSKSI